MPIGDIFQGHQDTYNACIQNHQAELSHECLAGAAMAFATKEYFNWCAQNGKPADHAGAKEALAGLAGGFIDREVETKGMDWIDTERAKRQAAEQADQCVQEGDYGY